MRVPFTIYSLVWGSSSHDSVGQDRRDADAGAANKIQVGGWDGKQTYAIRCTNRLEFSYSYSTISFQKWWFYLFYLFLFVLFLFVIRVSPYTRLLLVWGSSSYVCVGQDRRDADAGAARQNEVGGRDGNFNRAKRRNILTGLKVVIFYLVLALYSWPSSVEFAFTVIKFARYESYGTETSAARAGSKDFGLQCVFFFVGWRGTESERRTTPEFGRLSTAADWTQTDQRPSDQSMHPRRSRRLPSQSTFLGWPNITNSSRAIKVAAVSIARRCELRFANAKMIWKIKGVLSFEQMSSLFTVGLIKQQQQQIISISKVEHSLYSADRVWSKA